MGRGYIQRRTGGRGKGGGSSAPQPVFVCAPCKTEHTGEIEFLKHCLGSEHGMFLAAAIHMGKTP